MINKKFNKICLIRMDSRILKITAGHPKHFSPPFTLKYIQALLAKNENFQVKLIDCIVTSVDLKNLLDRSLDWGTEVMVVSSTTHSRELAMQFCSLVKMKKDVFVVAVGQGATAHSFDYCFPSSPFDVVLRGESEQEVISLLESLNSGENQQQIRETYRKKLNAKEVTLIWDLDSLPFPDYEDREIEAYRFFYPIRTWKRLRWGHILSSRGCHHGCIFCSQIIRETYGNKMRLRDPVKVVDEIEYLMGKGINIIAFDDDNFTASAQHVVAISSELIKRKLKIRWIAHARADELSIPLMHLMKKAGCVLLRFGIESASARIIRILKKNTRDTNWIETIENILRHCRKTGIATHALFMVGNPTETSEEIKATIQLAEILKPDLIQVHFFTPYPGSVIYENVCNHVIRNHQLSQMHHYAFPKVNLAYVDSDDLMMLRALFYRRFLLRPSFLLKHFSRYFLYYLANGRCRYALLKVFKILFQRRAGKRSQFCRKRDGGFLALDALNNGII
ncbi:MAG: hypothetical protein A2Y00_07055 [Omnitrophica WOR_2 bacterium GWF2_43_52]|nr:MAG: hypothetical protein A2Y00_07055 [Omnitrophica WOR_2 bacterium GWF2_43_52]OGX55716.1 MAG: hypothetical protein A2460_08260 [Omnitrophica WOR_2 bacterium RIFOXYC2_FULL_43_9]HAH19305.1 hypothetical protein [Candidatus Omnitrophota bacterium]HBG63672.1 hypothetical protein [Candidatus Omnitrophota bacterium]